MAKAKKDDKATEQDRIKKQLGVLGILLVLVVMANWKSISKMFGGDKRPGPVARRGRGRRAAPPRRGAPKRAAAKPARGGGKASSALTPQMIPVLSDEVKRKIKAVREKRPDAIPEDDIRYDTRNPFIALSLDDREIIKAQEKRNTQPIQVSAGADTGPSDASSAGGLMYFRGVVPIGGERFAVVQAAGGLRPRPVKEGDVVPNTNWRLLSIGPRDAFVVLYNGKAKRDREKISVVNRDGIRPEDLALAKELLFAQANVSLSEKSRKGSDAEQIAPIMLAIAHERYEKQQGIPAGGGFLGAPAAEDPANSGDDAGDPMAGGGDPFASTSGGDSPPPAKGADEFEFFDE